MQNTWTQRYRADPEALAAMKRDGTGWGHDLECGCFNAPRLPIENRSGAFGRALIKLLKRK